MTNTKKRGNTNAPTNTYRSTEPCQLEERDRGEGANKCKKIRSDSKGR